MRPTSAVAERHRVLLAIFHRPLPGDPRLRWHTPAVAQDSHSIHVVTRLHHLLEPVVEEKHTVSLEEIGYLRHGVARWRGSFHFP